LFQQEKTGGEVSMELFSFRPVKRHLVMWAP